MDKRLAGALENTADPTQSPPDDEPACSSNDPGLPSVTIKPAWEDWASALSAKGQSPARAALGLDPDRPIVMSGHQPIVFHNGILAKLIALDEAAKRTNAQPVWIVPDQDAVDLGLIRVPIGSGESLSVQMIELLPAGTLAPGVSAGLIESVPIAEPEHESLKPLAHWLDQYATIGSLAQQFGYATIEYACDQLGIDTPRLLFASELFQADAIEAIIDTMRADPALCAQSYNNAVAKYSDAGVRALVIEDDRIELPLWGCRANELRVSIDSTNINDFAPAELLPKGVLMSALARAHLADLFIHGTGGWIYDRISEDWFADWLGIKLAPMAMVTATQQLDLGFSPGETLEVADARWQLHHARHTPAMLGDTQTQARKDKLVAQIHQLAPRDPQRTVLYRELQMLLDDFRHHHADELAGFVSQAKRAQDLAQQYELAMDRTWSFVFFDQDAIAQLDRATRQAMG